MNNDKTTMSVVVPTSALDARRSPLAEETRTEYAVEAGGSVLNHKRFATQEDAYFYGCLLPDARDRERCGHVMIRRRVVQRRVVFDKWTPAFVTAKEEGAALIDEAAPRNCDIGTVDEQLERHRLYCIGLCTMHECGYDLEKHDTETCKKCFAKWAQMRGSK